MQTLDRSLGMSKGTSRLARLCAKARARGGELCAWPITLGFSILFYRLRAFEKSHGIVLALGGPDQPGAPTFEQVAEAALALIQSADKRRFRRLRREVKAIARAAKRVQWTVRYQRPLRSCMIHFESLLAHEDLDRATKWAACRLVYAASLAALRSRGIPFTAGSRARRAAICMEECRRFLLLLGDDEIDLEEALLK